jgi:uncharacterized protein (TIGR02145 family)
MAENLNYNACGSKCYNNQDSYCAIYGRLYDWATALALPSSCNSDYCSGQIQPKHRGVCPPGWHIPSDAEWKQLLSYVDDDYTDGNISTAAGGHLKAKDGWKDYDGQNNGQNTYGFAALPGGYGNQNDEFIQVGSAGQWWTSSQDGIHWAYSWYAEYFNKSAYRQDFIKSWVFSVRCVKD